MTSSLPRSHFRPIHGPAVIYDLTREDRPTADAINVFRTWIAHHGLDVAATYRVEGWTERDGFPAYATVYRYARGADGHFYCPLLHEHRGDLGHHSYCEMAKAEPITVLDVGGLPIDSGYRAFT